MSRRRLSRSCLAALICAAGPAFAQTANIKPPIAQAWIDVATFSGMGMPMGGLSGDTPLSALGSLFGGGTKNTFGQTQAGAAGAAFVGAGAAPAHTSAERSAARASWREGRHMCRVASL